MQMQSLVIFVTLHGINFVHKKYKFYKEPTTKCNKAGEIKAMY